jgi:hypothetical protein
MRWALLALLVASGAEAQRQPGWEVRVGDKVEVVTGASGMLSISIAVDRGLTISKDADVIVDLAPEQGITLRKKRLGRRDAVDPEADAPRFAVAVRADTEGEHAVKLRIRFWLCGGKSCRPIDVKKTAVIAASAPIAPTADAGTD